MTNEVIEKLLPKVKSVYPPDLEVSVKEHPLNQTRTFYLFIIKYNEKFDDIYKWDLEKVHKLYLKIWYVVKNEKLNDKVRFIFCYRNYFALYYTPTKDSELYQFDGIRFLDDLGIGDFEHFIGRVSNINKLIDYLITRRNSI